MIRVFLSGPHARRSPLSYPALAPLFEGRIALVERPDQADLHLFSHVLDLEDLSEAVIADWRRRRRPVVILSEEPFWDTIWDRRPLERRIVVETRFGAVPAVQLNHQTSGIFRFERIPYYLLTNHRFATTYAWRFTRNAGRSAAQWAEAFAARPVPLSFMFERRPEPHHDVRWDTAGLIGLCAWRTRLAQAFAPDEAEKLGRSWQGGAARSDLPDWYLDKMVRLDGRARMIGAIENTHQPDYVTEKLFDAFACGALPLYHAAPDHRVHEFGLPEGSWLNLYGLTPEEAADRVRAHSAAETDVEAFRAAQLRLRALFTDPGLFVAERARLQRAVTGELARVLDEAD